MKLSRFIGVTVAGFALLALSATSDARGPGGGGFHGGGGGFHGGGFRGGPGFAGGGFRGGGFGRPAPIGEFRGHGFRGNQVFIGGGGWPYYGGYGYYGWPDYYGGYYPDYYGADYWDNYYGAPTTGEVVYGGPVVQRRVTIVTRGNLAVNVQRILKREGFYVGPIDGIIGPESRAAIRAYQAAHGLPVTGRITGSLLTSLR